MIGAIAALGHNSVIGLGGTLPWHYAEDLKRFRRITLGATVIMGRATWQALPAVARPLPGRRNIVITRTDLDGVRCYRDIASALATVTGDTWFIGGAMLYCAALVHCDVLDISYVPDRIDDPAAVRFPAIDSAIWQAGPLNTFDADPRLSWRRFTRKDA